MTIKRKALGGEAKKGAAKEGAEQSISMHFKAALGLVGLFTAGASGLLFQRVRGKNRTSKVHASKPACERAVETEAAQLSTDEIVVKAAAAATSSAVLGAARARTAGLRVAVPSAPAAGGAEQQAAAATARATAATAAAAAAAAEAEIYDTTAINPVAASRAAGLATSLGALVYCKVSCPIPNLEKDDITPDREGFSVIRAEAESLGRKQGGGARAEGEWNMQLTEKQTLKQVEEVRGCEKQQEQVVAQNFPSCSSLPSYPASPIVPVAVLSLPKLRQSLTGGHTDSRYDKVKPTSEGLCKHSCEESIVQLAMDQCTSHLLDMIWAHPSGTQYPIDTQTQSLSRARALAQLGNPGEEEQQEQQLHQKREQQEQAEKQEEEEEQPGQQHQQQQQQIQQEGQQQEQHLCKQHGFGSDFHESHVPILGFDCEWRPEGHSKARSRVALLQLCGASGALLLRTHHLIPQPSQRLGQLSLSTPDSTRAAKAWVEEERPFDSVTDQSGKRGSTEDRAMGGADSLRGGKEEEKTGKESGRDHLGHGTVMVEKAADRSGGGGGREKAHLPDGPFHVCQSLPPSLVQLLGDPNIIKAGLGCKEDVKRLIRDYGVTTRGVVDVGSLASALAPELISRGTSLQALAKSVLGVNLNKEQQCSNWEASTLTEAQIHYAFRDAWTARQILLELFRRSHKQVKAGGAVEAIEAARTGAVAGAREEKAGGAAGAGARVAATKQAASRAGAAGAAGAAIAGAVGALEAGAAQGQESHVGGTLKAVQGPAPASIHESELLRFLAPFIDAPSKQTKGKGRGDENSSREMHQVTDISVGACGGNGHREKGARKVEEERLGHVARKKKLYENCRIMAPDGQVLCTCSAKKIQWYLERGLGSLEMEQPLTVRLHFEPQGRGHADDAYYRADKENVCVVCGIPCGDEGPQEGPSTAATAHPTPPKPLHTAERPYSVCLPKGHEAKGQDAPWHSSEEEPKMAVKTALNVGMAVASQQEAKERRGEGLEGNVGSKDGTGATGHRGSRAPPQCHGTHVGTEPTQEQQPVEGLKEVGGLRHSVVPHCYRRCFPLANKSHLSHDVVLMCVPCHKACGAFDHQRMAALGELYHAPLIADCKKFRLNKELAMVKSAARALLGVKRLLPGDRRGALEDIIARHFELDGVHCLTPDLIEAAGQVDPLTANTEWVPHAERVVASLLKSDDPNAIEEFVRGWRQHFLETMRPKRLPPNWGISARTASTLSVPRNRAHAASIGNALIASVGVAVSAGTLECNIGSRSSLG